MSLDDLISLIRALFDPTAPLPTVWPAGALGAFLVFATQIGAGIPIGVIMARDSGLNVLQTAGLYLASDVLVAVLFEPLLLLLHWESQRVDWVADLGGRLIRASGAVALSNGRLRGPLGIVLFSFVIAPWAARAVAQVAGRGPLAGWTLAIIGDMAYFSVIAASTLLVIHLFGESRMAIAPLAIGAWLLPILVQRLRRRTPASSYE